MDTGAGDKAEELLQRVDYLDEYLIKSIRFTRYQTRLTLVVVSPPVGDSIPTAYRIVFQVVREVLVKRTGSPGPWSRNPDGWAGS